MKEIEKVTRSLLKKALALGLAGLVVVISTLLTVMSQPVYAQTVLEYPTLPSGVQYYQTNYPTGLHYSEGWYGTFTYAPTALEVILFDDDWSKDWGIAIFSLPVGVSPTGTQGGTSVRAITQAEADIIIKSYTLDEAFKPFDAEIIAVMVADHFFNGVWAGVKLEQKWIGNPLLEIPPPELLTDRQREYIEATKDLDIKQVDLARFDPDRYWVGDGGNWSDNTNHWSASSNGTPGASLPTSADSVYFDANSFTIGGQTVTIDEHAYCLDMDWTNATNTPTLTMSASNYLYISGSLTLNANMVFTGGQRINFVATSPGKTITSNGITMNSYVFFTGVGGEWTLQDDISIATAPARSIYFNAGTLITDNNAITTYGLFIGQATTTVLTLGSSILTLTTWSYTGSNFTLNAGTSTIKISGVGAFTGGGLTYNNVELNGTAHTVSGNNTFASLTIAGTATVTLGATTQITGAWVNAGTINAGTSTIQVTGTGVFTGGGETYNNVELNGTDHTISGNNTYNKLTIIALATLTVTAGTTQTFADLEVGNDVTIQSTAGNYNLVLSDATFTSVGSGLALTDATVTTTGEPVNKRYWVQDGGNWSDDNNHWSVLSGYLPAGASVIKPTQTEDVYFDANSFSSGSQTVTVDETANSKDMDWTGTTNTPTLTVSNKLNIFGDITFIATMVLDGVEAIICAKTGTQTITTNTLSIGNVYLQTGIGTTVSFQDAFDGYAIRHTYGTLLTNNNDITLSGDFRVSEANATVLTMGSSTITSARWRYTGSNFTLTANTGTIKITGTGAFEGGGITTYYNVELNGTAHTISGSNTFSTLILKADTTQTITFTDGTTQTITTPTITGSAGNVKTLQGSGVGGWDITKAGGGIVALDYMSISRSTANPVDTWYAGVNSTDGGNNTNWFFNNQPLVFTTQAASGVTMDRDAVTGGSFNGNLGALVGTHNTSTWIDYGLTVGYGSSTAPVNRTTTGAFVVVIPANLTPGATYHYRFSGSNDAGTFNGNDQEFTFTMPTVATIAYTDSLGDISTPLQGDLTAMGVASDTYVGIEYGPTVAYGTLSSLTILAAISEYTTIITGYDSTVQLHYRAFAQVGSVFAYGVDNTIEGGRAIAYTLIRILLTLVIAAGTIITVLKTVGYPTLMLIFVVIGLIAFIFVQAVFG